MQRDEDRGALAGTAGEGFSKLEGLENKTSSREQQAHRFWDEREIRPCELAGNGQISNFYLRWSFTSPQQLVIKVQMTV